MATESPPPPFRPLPLQPNPQYLQLHLPNIPWYYFHEYLRTWISNRDAKESAVAFDLAFDPTEDSGGKLTLGGAEINLTTDQWTPFPGQGPKGIHRMAIPISILTYHIGGVNRLPGRRVFAVGAVYKVSAGGGGDRLDVTVNVGCITGAGEADFEGDYSQDYTMADGGFTRGQRTFQVTLEGGADRKGWTVVGAEGVEFQDQEVPGEVV